MIPRPAPRRAPLAPTARIDMPRLRRLVPAVHRARAHGALVHGRAARVEALPQVRFAVGGGPGRERQVALGAVREEDFGLGTLEVDDGRGRGRGCRRVGCGRGGGDGCGCRSGGCRGSWAWRAIRRTGERSLSCSGARGNGGPRFVCGSRRSGRGRVRQLLRRIQVRESRVGERRSGDGLLRLLLWLWRDRRRCGLPLLSRVRLFGLLGGTGLLDICAEDGKGRVAQHRHGHGGQRGSCRVCQGARRGARGVRTGRLTLHRVVVRREYGRVLVVRRVLWVVAQQSPQRVPPRVGLTEVVWVRRASQRAVVRETREVGRHDDAQRRVGAE